MGTLFILAVDRTVELSVDSDQPGTLAARYTTMAIAAANAKGAKISSIAKYSASTFARALNASPNELREQMARWAAATLNRYELLAPVCALLLAGSRLNASGLLEPTPHNIPVEVQEAASTLFGHNLNSCSNRSCFTCAAAAEGDWSAALRFSAGHDYEIAAAALIDAYRAARRAGLIPNVAPHTQDGSNFAPIELEDEKPVF